MEQLAKQLLAEIENIPTIDAHSHMVPTQLGAKDPGDILFYHMVAHELRAAGMPAKLASDRGAVDLGERVKASCEYWPALENTGFMWGLRTILSDLYGWDEPITLGNYEKLIATMTDKLANPDFGASILRRGKIVRLLSCETGGLEVPEGVDYEGMRPAVEMNPSFFAEEEPLRPYFEGLEKRTGVLINSADSARDAIRAMYDAIDWSDKHSVGQWLSSTTVFAKVDDSVVEKFFAARGDYVPTLKERDIISAFAFFAVLDAVREHKLPIQIATGCQYYGEGRRPVARANPYLISDFARVCEMYPDMHFNFLMGYEGLEHELACLATAYPNVSVSSAWWHDFYPSVMQDVLSRRLDITPINRITGFFTDGYCADWCYARLQISRRVIALTLARKIREGFYTEELSLRIARKLLLETPAEIFLPKEVEELKGL
ncbi:MAG: hypothetical protein QGD94_07940 [Planctomycetia bacterium]|nr:hypothetical protein [Planctomycetia bacterium]